MSHFKRRSLLDGDTCPVCRRRFDDIDQHQAAPRHLSLSLGNEHFELKFTGHVCHECYCKLAGTPQQSLFTTDQHDGQQPPGHTSTMVTTSTMVSNHQVTPARW